jgi:hypothetical protein
MAGSSSISSLSTPPSCDRPERKQAAVAKA